MARPKRKDKTRVVLKTGEGQRTNGTYFFRWTDKRGERHSVYAKTLDELRYKEEQIEKDKKDGIKAEARFTTVNDLFELWIVLKRGLKNNTFENYKYKVSELFRVTRGYVLAATQTETTKTDEKPYPVYSSQTKDKGLMGYYKDYLYEDAITWTTDGANAGTVNYRAGKFYCTNVCGVLLSNEVKANQMIAEALNSVAKGYVSYVGNPKLMNNVMADIVIQIPTQAEEREQLSSFFAKLDNLITLHQREFAFLCKEKSKKFRYIKNAWEQRKVREVTDRYDNLRIPVAASLRVAGTTPYYGANGIQDYVDGYTHDGEFILVAEDGANDLKNYPVKCVKGRIWVNNHAHVLQGKYDCADNQFLAYAISQADIESLLVGGGRAKLNAETLMGIDLLLPNKAEQIRIGKYLAQLDNLITLHQRKPNFYTGGYYAE